MTIPRVPSLLVRGSAGILLIACCLAVSGCSVADLKTPDRLERGLVIVLPGVEGKSRYNVGIARGLDDGGVRMAIEIFDWTTQIPGGLLVNLTDLERNRRTAEVLSTCILQYRFHHPDRPVHLVAHSGGAGVAIMALELLPQDAQVDTAVLLAAAVSPAYDLRPALERTRHGIYNYYSGYDKALLDVGTSIFGTMDRVHGRAAGSVGFRLPAGLDDPRSVALYRRLYNVSWQPEMREHGNWGGHVDWADRRWVRDYLAPLITDPKPAGVSPITSPHV